MLRKSRVGLAVGCLALWLLGIPVAALGAPPPPDPTGGSLDAYAILATNSVWLRKGSVVHSGDVGVVDVSPGPRLNAGVSLSVGKYAYLEDGTRALADSVKIKTGASLAELSYNTLVNRGTIRAAAHSPLTLPLEVTLPALPIPEPPPPDAEHLKANKGETLVLEPGSYGAITVKSRATLICTGGTYHIENLELGNNGARVLFRAPTVLVIRNRLRPGKGATIGPVENSGVRARDIRIYVYGFNGSAGTLNAKPKAAVIGKNNVFKANLYVPNGTLWIKAGTRAKGAFIARDVKLGNSAELTLDAGFGAAPNADDDGDGFTELAGDCDDADASVHPGAAEVCDGVDNDCSAATADGSSETPPLNTLQAGVCLGSAQVCLGGAWVDEYGGVVGYESAETLCDMLDNDCNGDVDEGLGSTFYEDADIDGYGVDTTTTQACTVPVGFAAIPGDCDDTDAGVNPGAIEVCGNGLDDNCEGVVDEGCVAALPDGSFGKPYEDLIPADATLSAYAPDRFSIVTGRVQGRDGLPIEAVRVTVHGNAAYGSALTDAEGRFSIPVEGGTTFTVDYERPDLLTSHRQVHVPWNDIAVVETVTMIGVDPAATPVTFDGNASTVVTHTSTPVTDEFGTRSTTLVLTGDNRAWVKNTAGTEVEVANITVRATEYATPESMPAKLPPTSAYTYCAELSIDEAPNVRFENPVTMWIDNFLGFPVGEIVPVGYYDRARAVWVPSDNGVVVQLLDTDSDGIVDALDSTGDGAPDDLNGNGIVSDEVEGLENPALYAANDTYWRAEVTHFTPWDCNWPYGPPPGAQAPSLSSQPYAQTPAQSIGESCSIQPINSVVEARDQVFHEDIPVPGTGMSLHYASNRVPGRKTVVTVPVSEDAVPSQVERIEVEMKVAGRSFYRVLAAAPNQSTNFVWDGRDAYEREVRGAVSARVRVGYVYAAVYYSPRNNWDSAFAQFGDGPITANSWRGEMTLWQDFSIELWRSQTDGLAAGWTLSGVHTFPQLPTHLGRRGNTVLKGDGTLAVSGVRTLSTWATSGASTSWGAINGAALDASGNPHLAAWDDDTGDYAIFEVSPAGGVNLIAGGGSPADSLGDGGLATQARLHDPKGLVFDAAGKLYIADTGSHRIRKIGVEGIISTVAGSGPTPWASSGYSGDGGPASAATLNSPQDVAVDATGALYIADSGNARVRKVMPSGTIETIAGTGVRGFSGDGGSALSADIEGLDAIAVDGDGNIYIAAARRVRRIDASGVITTVAGNGTAGDPLVVFNGFPAVDVGLGQVTALYCDAAGNLYITDDAGYGRVHRLDTSGLISTLAGGGIDSIEDSGSVPVQSVLGRIEGLTVASSGALVLGETIACGYGCEQGRLLRVNQKSATFEQVGVTTSYLLTEDSGVGHLFSSEGRHLSTVDLATRTALQTLEYDASGQLAMIRDSAGNATLLDVHGPGAVTTITSPDGLVTQLVLDGANRLQQVVYPDGTYYDFTYDAGGLMTDEYDPNGNHFEHRFDAAGRVTEMLKSGEVIWSYAQVVDDTATSYVDSVSGEGNLTVFTESMDVSGNYTSTIASPTGGVATFWNAADGLSATADTSCGQYVSYQYGLDPAYAFTFPTDSETLLPSGLQQTNTMDRAYADNDVDGSPDQSVDTVTVNGRTWSTTNDALAGTVDITSPEGRTIRLTYDPATLLAQSAQVPGLLPAFYAYDTRGRLDTVTLGSRSTYLVYDTNGYLDSLTTPSGELYDYTYDVMGRLEQALRPDGSVVRYAYDANGNLTILTTPKLVDHAFDYDENDQRTQYATPLSGSYLYTYDKERKLQMVTAPSGAVITNTYTDGVLASTDTPEGVISYSHDCSGKITGATRGAENVAFTFDGPLLTSDTRTGLLNDTLSYGYNNDFNLTSFTYAGDTETFGYDLDGLLTSAGGFTITRNAENGLPEAMSDGIVSLDRTFNGYGELDATTWSVAGTNPYSWTVTQRDAVGRITQKVETFPGATIPWDYQYDLVGRLEKVWKDGVLVEEYAYDANGNRTFETNTLRGISGRTSTHDAEDRIIQVGTDVYEFDLDGFLTRKTTEEGVTTYDYSSRGELLNVSLPDGTLITYDHDPLGRRVVKRVNGVIVEKYLWQGVNMKLLAVYDGGDNLVSRFTHVGGRLPASMTTGNATYYLMYDQVGSLRAIVDAGGAVVKRVDYDSFGNILADSNPPFDVPFGFTGGLHDQDTGLVRFGARDYDSVTGRWVAKDPIDFSGGDANLYGYVLDNPVSLVDQEGLWVQYAASGAVGAAAGALMVYFTTPNAPASVYLAAAGIGAVSGVAALHLGPKVFAQALLGGGLGVTSYISTTVLAGQQPNTSGVCAAAVGGAFGGMLGGLQPASLATGLISTWISGVRGAAMGWIGHSIQQQLQAPHSMIIVSQPSGGSDAVFGP